MKLNLDSSVYLWTGLGVTVRARLENEFSRCQVIRNSQWRHIRSPAVRELHWGLAASLRVSLFGNLNRAVHRRANARNPNVTIWGTL